MKEKMKPCPSCELKVEDYLKTCPNCGTPFSAKSRWDGFGYEYKSNTTIYGLPLVHICIKYKKNRMPVPAKGIIAIGQFAIGVFTLSQFGIGFFSISQFAIAAYAIAQFGIAYSLMAQIGIYINEGIGMIVKSIFDLL